MKKYPIYCALAGLALMPGIVSAQLSNLGGSARSQAQAQQRVQAQIQQRAAAAAQARIQADAARAARVAQQAAAMAQRQAEIARRQAAAGANAQAGVNAAVGARSEIAGQRARANANARLGIDANLIVPEGVTADDVRIYDEIFGRFNPLRSQRPAASQPSAPQPEADQVAEPANPAVFPKNQPPNDQPADDQPPATGQSPSRRPAGVALNARNELDLHARLVIAMRQRRAQISELRDRAVEAGNAQLLLQAERMEEAMNAFLAARSRMEAEGQAAAAGSVDSTVPPEPPAPSTTTADGSGNVQGTTEVR